MNEKFLIVQIDNLGFNGKYFLFDKTYASGSWHVEFDEIVYGSQRDYFESYINNLPMKYGMMAHPLFRPQVPFLTFLDGRNYTPSNPKIDVLAWDSIGRKFVHYDRIIDRKLALENGTSRSAIGLS